MADWIEQLERLTKLHQGGALSDQEFAEQKARLLADRPAAPSASLSGLASDNPPFESDGVPLKWILIGVPLAILLGVLAWTQLIDTKGEIKPAPLPGASASASASDGVSAAATQVAASAAATAAASTAASSAIAASDAASASASASPAAARTFNPSFSCAGLSDRVLLLICRDSELSRKDRSLSERFRARLRGADAQERQDLLQKQRGFLRERNRCGNIGCLHEWYDRTIDFYY